MIRILLFVFVFLLPFHALLVTSLKCKFWVNTDLLRFWKEFFIIFFLWITIVWLLKRYKFNIKKIYKWNYLLWVATAFIICSFIYIFFPFFEIKASSLLWFKYDVFFIFAFLIWLYLPTVSKNLNKIITTLFISTFLILIIFLPWYISWNISSTTNIFWYSSEVSTYEANSCLSFSQNVNGEHRFQATFWWPIRFSVFLVVFYFLFIWYILKKDLYNKNKRNILIWITSLLFFTSIYFSYSKTSALWILFWFIIFLFLVRKYIYWKKIEKKFLLYISWLALIPIIIISIFKGHLFLHLSAVINRLDNISKSIEMFFYNPIWYWLWIAWPASQVWNTIESAWSWQAAAENIIETYKFLPENWYIQILLEQWIVWLALFVYLLILIWLELLKIVKKKKNYFSIWIFSAFLSIVFMANFTHWFEESATSYIMFLILWWYIALNRRKK